MKTYMWLIVILMIQILLSTEIYAQPGMPMSPSQAPIDGGLGILAAAGGSYALHKLRKRRDQKEEELR